MSIEPTVDFVKTLEVAVEQRDTKIIREVLKDVHAADISIILDRMSADECRYILSLLDKEISADVISELEEDTQRDFLKDFEPVELAGYMDYTDSDDAADILNLLPVKMKEEVITSLKNKEKVAHITDLLKYDEDCAGGLMAKELIKANINWNIKQCIEEIRRQTKNVEKILTVYVVDDFGMLQGRVSLKKIILSNDDTRIKDIAVPQVHDFIYGFDWAKWVKKDIKNRKSIQPFSYDFLQRMYLRGKELELLIEQNDAKYHQLGVEQQFRNPFLFHRNPKEETSLLKQLADLDLIPIKTWEINGSPVWKKNFQSERNKLSIQLGFKK